MTELDQKIRSALKSLNDPKDSSFDLGKYIAEFRPSARDKAEAVLVLLRDKAFPFPGGHPVFVSIGGGDGEEVDYLLRNTDADRGVLVEMGHQLAAMARERNTSLPIGKRVEVFEGDAKDKIAEAISYAHQIVSNGEADYVAVTCHAVIHELFDRGKDRFDALAFFATLFSNVDVPTWFTYREPGVPEKWPAVVLLSADCQPQSLVDLADAINARHQNLRELSPHPLVVGDHVRLHSTLAMEVLAKLFYLSDLAHEIEERSTAVDHRMLTNTLWVAIGQTARREDRANIISFSAPTKSFMDLWQRLGVKVEALDENSLTAPLAIAESHTRLVAWRQSPSAPKDSTIKEETIPELSGSEEPLSSDLAVATEALNKEDFDLLSALLVSKGRAWIESADKETAIRLLRDVTANVSNDRLAHLWSHYLLSIGSLFSGEDVSPEMFSERLEVLAGPVGLALLFRAERMEFHRKLDRGDEAVAIANTLWPVLNQTPDSLQSQERYVVGTCKFLLGSLLRYGGLYANAWDLIDSAQRTFLTGIDSHDTELAHCYYAKAVCAAMTGVSNFDAPFDLGSESTRRFAGALIQLSYSHAAWFLDDVARSKEYALAAAASFESIGTPRYAARAKQLAALLECWDALRSGKAPQTDSLGSTYGRAIAALTGHSGELSWVVDWLRSLRPSKALGLLQFAREYSPAWESEIDIVLPRTLESRSDGSFAWRSIEEVRSLKEADEALRRSLSINLGRRIPLIAD